MHKRERHTEENWTHPTSRLCVKITGNGESEKRKENLGRQGDDDTTHFPLRILMLDSRKQDEERILTAEMSWLLKIGRISD